ncbi:transposase [Sphingobacterium sp. DN00404]|uniref:Transposase n=1 Tax=Sphingobacterium micropteri TaxID=2763501 RepID=A0ABR7YMS3_9SPHI|nr:transposase [Sphingobacterium micropteri]MBD1432516.1 transposase [Sphingobacterium micropteri]
MMKKLTLGTLAFGLFLAGACQNTNGKNEEAEKLAKEAIEIHDEIMPQISTFNKHDILIDSLLENLSVLKTADVDLDTTETREKFHALKANLESANDKMMVWMKEYAMDSTDVNYQKAEVERISELKTEFEQVKYEAESLLAPFKK